MNAVISGRCATALLIDGERLMSIHADAIQQPVLRQSADLPFLFGDCNDLQFLEDITFDKVAAQLKRACDNDDALQMILILLDSELSSEVREEAAEALEELLTDELPTIKFAEIPTKIFDEPLTNDYVSEYLKNLLYARPLPENTDLDGAIECCEVRSAVLVQYFLEKLQKLQPTIQKVRLAWEAIPKEIFGSEEVRAKWHAEILRQGAFHNLVVKIINRKNAAEVHAPDLLNSKSKSSPEFEVIHRAWLKSLQNEFSQSKELITQQMHAKENLNAKDSEHFDAEWIVSRRDAIKNYLLINWNFHGVELEEVLQETLTAALQSFPNYESRNKAGPTTYLKGVAKNVAQSYVHRLVRYERRRAPIKLAKTIEIDFKDQIEVEEIAQTLKEKLLELPTKYIQVLELIYYQDYRESEAADKLGISVDKLYSLKSEALKRLRKLCANDSRLKP